MIVRAGNGRMTAALELGWSHLPATVFDEDDNEAVAFAVADNRTAELAEWDWNNLTEALTTLSDANLDVNSLGFSDDDLREMLESSIDSNFENTESRAETNKDPDAYARTTFSVIVDFDNPDSQRELLEEMEKRGKKCRLMMF